MREEVVGRARRELGRPAAPPSGVGRSSALPLRRRPVRGGELQEAARVLTGAGRRGGARARRGGVRGREREEGERVTGERDESSSGADGERL